MKISPLDIQQQQFKGKFFGGLDPEDVDAFLQMVAEEMENLIRENNDLKEQAREIAADMSEMGRRESDLRETMLAAQKITEEMKANAQKEATLLISEAELKGERILSNSEKKLVELNNHVQELRRQKMQFETAFKSLLDTHFKMLSMHEE
ncbi:MAG: DivIVA domain-containing protein [Geobacteraceae bacterium]